MVSPKRLTVRVTIDILCSELLLWDELYNEIAASEAPVLLKQWGQLESQLHVMRAQLDNRQKSVGPCRTRAHNELC